MLNLFAILVGNTVGAFLWVTIIFFLAPLITAGAFDPAYIQSIGIGVAIQLVILFFGLRRLANSRQ